MVGTLCWQGAGGGELGPFYRIVCRDGDDQGSILGIANGFVAPLFGLMHCDTMQIFTRGLKGADGQRLRSSPLGLGLLLGGAMFAYGHARGCRKAELLAINDDDVWHERLVRYYSYFGFRPVRVVGGNGLADWPHLLVWGGEGTRMDADIGEMLERWSPALRRGGAEAGAKGPEGSMQVEGLDGKQREGTLVDGSDGEGGSEDA
ncbi:hypothetical protein GPECTOR_46g205 [Gonium pectorale]|uniref:N-acetyltransferase domain-containing protein n=1 Tax=Gonium pectorale TaxID=33097 RepID=A0A150G8E8_GONPE|nr:hypothetical protein GPECTOR_46g205 [Gonium pectorale]|eukprot:KXZ46136.1 hypothetical protein GPECTOR_46g205 [Gonium pectorale]